MTIKNFSKLLIKSPILLAYRIYKWAFSGNEEKDPLKSKYPNVVLSKTENIKIGERVFIGNETMIIALGKVTIGDDTMIAPKVMILTATHRTENNPMWKETVIRPVFIGKHVWIGARVIILPGVKIGDFAVIGAGTIVSRHIPEKAVVIGNPARIIKYRDLAPEDISVKYGVWIDTFEDYLPDKFVTRESGK